MKTGDQVALEREYMRHDSVNGRSRSDMIGELHQYLCDHFHERISRA